MPDPEMGPCPYEIPRSADDWSEAEKLHSFVGSMTDRGAPAIDRLWMARRLSEMVAQAVIEMANQARREGASWEQIAVAFDSAEDASDIP